MSLLFTTTGCCHAEVLAACRSTCCSVGAINEIKFKCVPCVASCSYFIEGILLSKGSKLCNNISTENWCQYPEKEAL